MKKTLASIILMLLFFETSPAETKQQQPALVRQPDELARIIGYNPACVTTVYARDGQVLGYLYRQKRFPVHLDDVPRHVIQAFLAAEDSSFYDHEGIDPSAIFRALAKNISSGNIVQGGSTITQQVVKRIVLSSRRSYFRKFKEAVISYRIEHYLTKNEILNIYLNDIFLGSGAYGVEAGARSYFAKHLGDVTLAEASLLAGLPKAPSRYNPYRFPDAARVRQEYVLGRMRKLNWITDEEHKNALEQPVLLKKMPDPSWKLGAYYLDEVRRVLTNEFSEENMKKRGITLDCYGEDFLYTAGLHVHTAVDLTHQAAAERALRAGLEASSKRMGWRGPIIKLTPEEYDFFLNQAHVQEPLTPGQWVRALVLKTKKSGAKVTIGNRTGFIHVHTMRWCRRPDPSKAPEELPPITDARKVLDPGDVVWASVMDPGKNTRLHRHGVISLALEQRPRVQGALVSIEPPTGDVVALVGGYAFSKSQFNRASRARRQPGSSFKPIVFSAAIDKGYTPSSIIMDEPLVFFDPATKKTWEPKNFAGNYYGPMRMRTALVKSSNLATIKIAKSIGIKNVISRAKQLGIQTRFAHNLALSLGALNITPLNLCQAYTAFAREGSYVKPRLVLSVTDSRGREIMKNDTLAIQAIDAENAFMISGMLKEAVQRGTGVRARVLKRPVAGKTGTTNDERDAWFVGFTPYLLSGVYVGFDRWVPMGKSETGSRAALPIWVGYRLAVEDQYPLEDFTPPRKILTKHIDANCLPEGTAGF